MVSATRPIELASLQGDLAIIKKGITPGEVVVTDGQNQLKPGSKVAPRAAEKTDKSVAGASTGAVAPEPAPSPSGSAGAPRRLRLPRSARRCGP